MPHQPQTRPSDVWGTFEQPATGLFGGGCSTRPAHRYYPALMGDGDGDQGDDVLTCPECSRTLPDNLLARIGNRKTKCALCNRFSQAVRRQVARDLAAAHPEEAAWLRRHAEASAYTQIVGSTDRAGRNGVRTP